MPTTTPSSHPHALSTHTTDPTLPESVTDIMARRPHDPAALEPLPQDLLDTLNEEVAHRERLAIENAALRSKAVALARSSEEALARAKAAERNLRLISKSSNNTLSQKDFLRLWINTDNYTNHPCLIRATDPTTGTEALQISVILNPAPKAETFNSKTSYIIGETILHNCVPVTVMTPRGPLPLTATGQVRLKLTPESVAALTASAQNHPNPTLFTTSSSDHTHPDDNPSSPAFIPSNTLTGSTPTPPTPNALDRKLSHPDPSPTLSESLLTTLRSLPPSTAQSLLSHLQSSLHS